MPNSLIEQLLAYAAATNELDGPAHFSWHVGNVDERQFKWTMAAGLGALLHRGTADARSALPHEWREPLQSAHLTARVVHGNRMDTTRDVIDVCNERAIPVTLLKGISTCTQVWPATWLRPMGDVDLLVPAGRYAECERALLARGFRQLDEGDPEDAPYHGPPFYDPPRNTWVELHTSLFPGTSELVGNSLFGAGCVARETRACAFEGRKCYRLSQELQVVYIAASWMSDMTSHGIDPSFVTALFDAVYLLKAARRSLDWPIVIGLLDNELAAASLWLMLGFLARHHLAEVDAEVLAQIAQRQRLVGALQASVIHAMLDRYVLGGRPWNLRIPLPVAGRYSIHRQWRKRIARRHLVCASAC